MIEIQHQIIRAMSRHPVVTTLIWLCGVNKSDYSDVIKTNSGNFYIKKTDSFANWVYSFDHLRDNDEDKIINKVIDIADVDEWGFYFDGDITDADENNIGY